MEDPSSLESVQQRIINNKQMIAAATEWTAELQMRLEQTTVLEAILESWIDK